MVPYKTRHTYNLKYVVCSCCLLILFYWILCSFMTVSTVSVPHIWFDFVLFCLVAVVYLVWSHNVHLDRTNIFHLFFFHISRTHKKRTKKTLMCKLLLYIKFGWRRRLRQIAKWRYGGVEQQKTLAKRKAQLMSKHGKTLMTGVWMSLLYKLMEELWQEDAGECHRCVAGTSLVRTNKNNVVMRWKK